MQCQSKVSISHGILLAQQQGLLVRSYRSLVAIQPMKRNPQVNVGLGKVRF